ncbi:glycosyltransferase family 1 protein [Glaciihabitans arcticus]|uniref:Glycosyltransferase family 1 protein n=1 Tax=Glaciihabitans arcticus TaxID=2668039 RepID=A0A4Q9GS56_9MICO|nr:glycosyltransferase family 1 protein [Glaciihabitans arcticus]TBN55937.1 glycosyltransferase family 1 protein [Glaciihabitans arcticus]
MTTLRIILDDMLAPVPNGISRYTEELARALIVHAPLNCTVEGIVAASTEPEYNVIGDRLPGLKGLYKSSLARRELVTAWQHGFTRVPGGGMIHAPSLLAPLSRHDRLHDGHQIAVTIHDVVAWTHPDSLPARRVAWHKAMAQRAFKYADAVVVPTHAVAVQLSEIHDFGDRLRVVGGAVGSRLTVQPDADARAARLGLPDRYLLTIGGLESRRGIDQLLAALALPGATDLPLLVVGPDSEAEEGDGSVSAAAAEAGLPEGRVRALGALSDEDLSVVLDRAVMLVFPTLAEGFGLPMLEAFHFGTPVVHSDAPALVEVAGEAGYGVELEGDGYPQRLLDAINHVAHDHDLQQRLGTYGRDRAGLFTWQAAAEKVWQLHADL